MPISLKVKEKIARVIGSQFTTNEIVNVFTEAKISTDKELYAKWRITLDAFSKINGDEELFRIIEEFCHPLNFSFPENREKFIDDLNKILSFDNLKIESTDRTAKVVLFNEKNIEITKEGIEEIAKQFQDVNKSNFTEKVLELVAEEFCKRLSNFDIRKIITPIIKKNLSLYNHKTIKGYLVDEMFEENPFDTFNNTLQIIRRKDEEADKTISEIISALLHPLNYNADESKTEEIAAQLSKYLRYDNFYIQDTGKDYLVFSEQEMEEMHTSSPEFEEQERQDKEEDERKIKENKEIIRGLRDTHQAYISILEIYCEDTKKPTKELNDSYIFLSNTIEKTIKELGLKTYPYQIFFYKPFKNDLYSAEAEWKAIAAKKGIRLSWDGIRPSLYKVHSDIIRVLNMAEEDTQMTDEEKKLESINKLISERRAPKPLQIEPEKTMKIEIASMPDLNIRNIEDNIIVKKKKNTVLPRFPATPYEQISIRFLTQQDVLITTPKKQLSSNYEALGFSNDKENKPNTAWVLLSLLANNGGEMKPPKPIPDTLRQQKRQLADQLKLIFKNSQDPFEDFSETNSYRLKIKLEVVGKDEAPDRFGTQEYLDETMTKEAENYGRDFTQF